jgi:hypothetical protein
MKDFRAKMLADGNRTAELEDDVSMLTHKAARLLKDKERIQEKGFNEKNILDKALFTLQDKML